MLGGGAEVDASAAVQAAEEEPKQAPEREVVCVLAEAEVDEDVADDEDVVAEVVVDEVVKAEEEDVESDEDVQENAIEEEARSQKTWEELEVTLDCTAGVNMTGLHLRSATTVCSASRCVSPGAPPPRRCG